MLLPLSLLTTPQFGPGSAPLELSSKPHQTPSKFHACSMPPELQSSPRKLPISIPPCLHVCTPAASGAPDLHTSTAARLQRASRPPFLHTYTPAARLPSPRAPYLYASTSARPQRTS